VQTRQLAATETVGAVGTLANLEQHVRRNPRGGGKYRFLDVHDQALAAALGQPLPDTVHPTTAYLGDPRLFVPTVRGCRACVQTAQYVRIGVRAQITRRRLRVLRRPVQRSDLICAQLVWRTAVGRSPKVTMPKRSGRWKLTSPTGDQAL